jgi:hypothetical protein
MGRRLPLPRAQRLGNSIAEEAVVTLYNSSPWWHLSLWTNTHLTHCENRIESLRSPLHQEKREHAVVRQG